MPMPAACHLPGCRLPNRVRLRACSARSRRGGVGLGVCSRARTRLLPGVGESCSHTVPGRLEGATGHGQARDAPEARTPVCLPAPTRKERCVYSQPDINQHTHRVPGPCAAAAPEVGPGAHRNVALAAHGAHAARQRTPDWHGMFVACVAPRARHAACCLLLAACCMLLDARCVPHCARRHRSATTQTARVAAAKQQIGDFVGMPGRASAKNHRGSVPTRPSSRGGEARARAAGWGRVRKVAAATTHRHIINS